MKKKQRPRLNKPISGGLYFDGPTQVRCISSGCRLLDRVLGNGWGEGRVGNIVGDKSTGKTLAMIEACANFVIEYPNADEALIRYAEAEAAFDEPYAQTVGLPLERVEMNPEEVFIDTVEDWYNDLEAFIDKVAGVKRTKFKTKPDKLTKISKPKKAGLYIIDSLDAIGDDDEKESAFGKESYGVKKAKLIGQLFRRMIRRLKKHNITLLIVSQTRDKIGVSFGDKLTRSGGKALDFYASQIVWLSDLGKIEDTRGGVKRKVGAWVRAKCKKNKIGLAWRECDFPIRYAFGIDDMDAALTWLDSVNMLDEMSLTKESAKKWIKALDSMTPEEVAEKREELNRTVDRCWWEIERRFLPKRRKYG